MSKNQKREKVKFKLLKNLTVLLCLFSSANATPEFEGRGGEELANELSGALTRAYSAPQAFDKTVLCILAHQQCWKLYVDILVSNYYICYSVGFLDVRS